MIQLRFIIFLMLNVPGAHDGSQIKLRTQSNLHLLYLRPSNRGEVVPFLS